MKRWIAEWSRVGPILDAERLAGLRRLDDAESARIEGRTPQSRRAPMTTTPLVDAARELLDYLQALGRSACLIGGMVVARSESSRSSRSWTARPA
jgi:hypothetical protein